jgi:hypothetical protein
LHARVAQVMKVLVVVALAGAVLAVTPEVLGGA